MVMLQSLSLCYMRLIRFTTHSVHHCARVCMMATDASQKIGMQFSMAERLKGTDKSIWVEFSRLSRENDALNLGQGFPDFFPPSYVTAALQQVACSDNPFVHQYTPSFGHPRLTKVLAKLYSTIFNKHIDETHDVLVTPGAYGSLFCAAQGFINPGDEAILIEPFFDSYEPSVKVAGGIPVSVPLRPNNSGETQSSSDWTFDRDELASKFNERTKVIFFNNPNNPLGKVYTMDEMTFIAELCKKHNVIVICDEVYEWIVYKPHHFIRMANLPDMWERTVSIGSAGKTFSVTGWKLGWTIGPKHLLHAMRTVHQHSSYTCPTPLQEAVAIAFETELSRLSSSDCYFNSISLELEPKKKIMADLLSSVGMTPIIPQGGYFMVADISKLGVKLPNNSKEPKDYRFCKWMVAEKKLTAIPVSSFYMEPHKPLAENLIRFCFIKENGTLKKAEAIFSEWRSSL